MTPEDRIDEVVEEIRRVSNAVEPIRVEELLARRTESQLLDPPADRSLNGVEWLVPTSGGDPMEATSRRRLVLMAAAAVLVLLLAAGGLAIGGQNDEAKDSELETADRAPAKQTQPEPAPDLSPVEIVERRYEALNGLELDALHRDVSSDATFCFLFLGSEDTAEGCQDTATGYHDRGGLGDQDEILALQVHAYGGSVDYNCTGNASATVVCTQQTNHLFVDRAGDALHLLTVTYEVRNDQIVSIDKVPNEAEGVARMAVRSEEAQYVAWLGQQYPDELDDLVVLARPRTTPETVARHRQLVTEWFEATS